MTTYQYVITTITRFFAVMTYNQMVIRTSTGKPLIVDQNPAQKLYVMLPNCTVTLISVTDLKVGYTLFDAMSQTWVPITSIHYRTVDSVSCTTSTPARQETTSPTAT